MRCSKAQRLISDHVDHLLEGRQVGRLEDHLQKCPGCRDLLAEMLSMVDEAKQLEIAGPSEDLWPAIRKGIEEGRSHGGRTTIRTPEKKRFFGFAPHPARLIYGAGAVLAAVILAFVFSHRLPFLPNEGRDPRGDELSRLVSAERQYQAAIEVLDKAVSDRKAGLSPEMARVFKTNIGIIDDSIRACRVALDEHPKSRVVNAHLVLCYRKKMELLNEMRNMAMQSG